MISCHCKQLLGNNSDANVLTIKHKVSTLVDEEYCENGKIYTKVDGSRSKLKEAMRCLRTYLFSGSADLNGVRYKSDSPLLRDCDDVFQWNC